MGTEWLDDGGKEKKKSEFGRERRAAYLTAAESVLLFWQRRIHPGQPARQAVCLAAVTSAEGCRGSARLPATKFPPPMMAH